ncbi:hypothetical protein KZC51_17385 [Microbacterium sp. SSW1-49]|uniref:DUF1269 domain-containing family protein n=1 Tax=Microbacterium croceum TaxID=2851645 RepID=A0ABT0FIM4_9MICO|nr:DUF6325 family protein [Microbacterium croceum]MCK2037905.1 hypothetical protein [Microbacterium croceum]
MANDRFAGPVDFLVFVFDEHADLGTGLVALLERVESGLIEILDIEFVARGADGGAVKRAIADLDGITGVDLRVFEGVESGVLDAVDLAAIAAELHRGQVALAIVYEDRSLAAAAEAWVTVGGAELFSGGVDIADLESALEERKPA